MRGSFDFWLLFKGEGLFNLCQSIDLQTPPCLGSLASPCSVTYQSPMSRFLMLEISYKQHVCLQVPALWNLKLRKRGRYFCYYQLTVKHLNAYCYKVKEDDVGFCHTLTEQQRYSFDSRISWYCLDFRQHLGKHYNRDLDLSNLKPELGQAITHGGLQCRLADSHILTAATF